MSVYCIMNSVACYVSYVYVGSHSCADQELILYSPSHHLPVAFSILELLLINRLTPNNPYMGRTAPLISKRCILYIYSTNTGTEYFKHALYPPFFSLQNAVCFIKLTCLFPVLFTFYIQGVLKLKK